MSLQGASIVNTRASGAGGGLARLLRRRGADSVVSLPGQRLQAVVDADAARAALRAAARGDALVFVSPAAVRQAWRLLPQWRLPRRLTVCAVGAATAAALHRRGVAAVVRPSTRQDSEGLLAEAALHGVRGQSWAVIGAAGGRDILPVTLRRRGARVAAVEVYRRAPPRWTRRHYALLETAPRPLLIIVSSAQSLAQIATALPAGLVLALRAGELVVSSDRLALLAREHGFSRIHVSKSALPADLADACGRALARHRL
ncbi:MAG: uroporphyrinogen-III synthase [Rhodanobacteraceae bacterium]|nr:uroporphyrinogen-III synthase [Rhodanobacteraceae bacterium]